DPQELAQMRQRLTEKRGQIRAREALVAALSGQRQHEGADVAVITAGAFHERIQQLRDAAGRAAEPPTGFQGTLRPYQQRGLAWLQTLAALGLGACLADDMGLGKTIQILA